MRIFLSISLLAFTLATATAGRLDIAVIQFPEPKTPEQLNAALSSGSLFDLTNSSRTMTSESDLKGGTVIFAQSITTSGSGAFGSSTRLGDQRADVSGALNGGSVNLKIEIMEGVKAGLRSFQNKIFSGNGSLAGGKPQVLSMRIIKGKAPNVTKGVAKLVTYELSTAVIAQYTP